MRTKVERPRNFSRTRGARLREGYLALFRAYPIRPIRSDEELQEALDVARLLFCRRNALNDQEEDYFQLLSHEIERYEAAAYPLPVVSAPDMLRHLMDARDATLSKVAAGSGISLSTLSAVLNGKRELNLTHIRSLASYFSVEPSVFLE